MTEAEKKNWFEDNKQFYEALANDDVYMSDLQKPYYYANNAGNNAIVKDVINSYNSSSKNGNAENILCIMPYRSGFYSDERGSSFVDVTYGYFTKRLNSVKDTINEIVSKEINAYK